VVAAKGLGTGADACVLGTRCAVAVALAGLVAVCAVLADHTAQTLTANEAGLARTLPGRLSTAFPFAAAGVAATRLTVDAIIAVHTGGAMKTVEVGLTLALS